MILPYYYITTLQVYEKHIEHIKGLFLHSLSKQTIFNG